MPIERFQGLQYHILHAPFFVINHYRRPATRTSPLKCQHNPSASKLHQEQQLVMDQRTILPRSTTRMMRMKNVSKTDAHILHLQLRKYAWLVSVEHESSLNAINKRGQYLSGSYDKISVSRTQFIIKYLHINTSC